MVWKEVGRHCNDEQFEVYDRLQKTLDQMDLNIDSIYFEQISEEFTHPPPAPEVKDNNNN